MNAVQESVLQAYIQAAEHLARVLEAIQLMDARTPFEVVLDDALERLARCRDAWERATAGDALQIGAAS